MCNPGQLGGYAHREGKGAGHLTLIYLPFFHLFTFSAHVSTHGIEEAGKTHYELNRRKEEGSKLLC